MHVFSDRYVIEENVEKNSYSLDFEGILVHFILFQICKN